MLMCKYTVKCTFARACHIISILLLRWCVYIYLSIHSDDVLEPHSFMQRSNICKEMIDDRPLNY